VHLVAEDSVISGRIRAPKLLSRGLENNFRQRVRLVNGAISIESRPMDGTRIYLRVPLNSEQNSQREAVL